MKSIAPLSKEWFDFREERVTGSIIGAILGVSPFTKPYDIFKRKVNKEQVPDNAAMAYGRALEDLAKEELEQSLGLEILPAGIISHPEYPWLAATPDGIIERAHGIEVVEIKCPYSRRNGGTFDSIEALPWYYAQVQYEMFVYGASSCHFYQWAPWGDRYECVDFSQEFIDETLPTLKAFHSAMISAMAGDKTIDEAYLEYVQHMTDVEGFIDDVSDFIDGFESVAAELSSVSDEIKALQEREKSLKLRLHEVTKGMPVRIGQYNYIKVERKGSVDYDAILRENGLENIDLNKYRKDPSVSFQLRIAK